MHYILSVFSSRLKKIYCYFFPITGYEQNTLKLITALGILKIIVITINDGSKNDGAKIIVQGHWMQIYSLGNTKILFY